MRSPFFCVVMQRILVVSSEVSGKSIGLIFRGQLVQEARTSWPIGRPETSVINYKHTPRNSLEERIPDLSYQFSSSNH